VHNLTFNSLIFYPFFKSFLWYIFNILVLVNLRNVLHSFLKSLFRDVLDIFILVNLWNVLHSFLKSLFRDVLDIFILVNLWHVLSNVLHRVVVCYLLLSGYILHSFNGFIIHVCLLVWYIFNSTLSFNGLSHTFINLHSINGPLTVLYFWLRFTVAD
jgi:uncharacterized membrane protein (DUF373 family)